MTPILGKRKEFSKMILYSKNDFRRENYSIFFTSKKKKVNLKLFCHFKAGKFKLTLILLRSRVTGRLMEKIINCKYQAPLLSLLNRSVNALC